MRTNHPAIKILVVSWIKFLDSIPEIKLINRIFHFLPGLFDMLCDKTKDVNQASDTCLKMFLKEIEKLFENCDIETTNKIIEIIIDQCKNKPDTAIDVAFDWLINFLNKYSIILNKISYKNLKYYTKSYKRFNLINTFNPDGKKIGNLNMTNRSRIINSQDDFKDRKIGNLYKGFQKVTINGNSLCENNRKSSQRKKILPEKKKILFSEKIETENEVKSDDEKLKSTKKLNEVSENLNENEKQQFKTEFKKEKDTFENKKRKEGK
jgi:hypothetical protein